MRAPGLVRVLGCVVGAAAFALLTTSEAFATAADPNAIVTLKQPDGRTFKAHIWGDEYIHGYEALNGHTVVMNGATKSWTYAVRGPRGRLKPSTAVVTRDRPLAVEHLRPTARAFTVARARENVSPVGKPLLQAAPPWSGNDTDLLFIMVRFTDQACTFTPAQMQTNMFGGGASGAGDLDAYYNEISYGDVQLVGTVVGDQGGTTACIPLANNRAFYNNNVANPDGDDDLVREALANIDANVNFEDYDNDGDGTIDALGIIYAGGGAHDGCAGGTNADNLWPHSGGVGGGQSVDGGARTANPFIINSEITYPLSALPGIVPADCTVIQTIGLFAHELGHSLGLPDLYDRDASPNGGSGVDVWSVMASQYLGRTNNADTPPHPDPWSKWHQGWVTPTEHAAGDRFVDSISRAEDNGEVHQFLGNPGGVNWVLGPPRVAGTGEYFLVENRQQALFDAQLPGCGIVVWHIDESQLSNDATGHTAGSHRLVDIEEADGLGTLDQNGQNSADAGDPFPGSGNKRLFGDGTNPSSKLYSGTSSNVRMWVQTTTDCTTSTSMSAAFGPNQAPTADAGGPYQTNEGTDKGLTAAGSTDPDSGDTLTYEWDLDNDGDFDDSTSQTPTFTLVGDNAVRTVRVKVTDSFGDSSTDSATVTVLNVKPTVTTLSNTGPILENTAVTISGVVSDPGWLDTFSSVTVDWDDGNGPQALPGVTENGRPDATYTFTNESHTYGDNGTYAVTVCATDHDGATTAPCGVTSVIVTNVDPTAVIDLTGTVTINGTATFVAHEGQVIPFSASSFDPGSDDRTTTWDWGDGGLSPDVTTVSLNGTLPDLPKSPTINPRTVNDPEPHAFASACFYTVTFGARDDDAGSASANVAVIIAGNAALQRGAGYWQTQYRPRPTAFSEARRQCYLAIARFMSTVFIEQRALGTVAQAFDVMSVAGNGGDATQKLDRELLAAWLNFANGAFDLTELVDTDGKNGPDTPFATVMATAESARTGPSTDAQKLAQRDILARINGN
jgi:M6 family metalloprotease-like protein